MENKDYISRLARLKLIELQEVKNQLDQFIALLGTPSNDEDKRQLQEAEEALKMVNDEIQERDWQ